MPPIEDYIYRYAGDRQHAAGRCRVRIYRRTANAHTVLLSELSNNAGQPLADAAARIATALAARWKLNPRTTRWVYHDGTGDAQPHFDEVEFTWDAARTAGPARWTAMSRVQAEALTGASAAEIERPIGDPGA